MKALIYNICGFGLVGRRTQLRDYVRRERLDLIGLQETIKQDFSMAELRSLECGGQFVWNWLPATGHSGGLLLEIREECLEVGDWKKGIFFPLDDSASKKLQLEMVLPIGVWPCGSFPLSGVPGKTRAGGHRLQPSFGGRWQL
jgi:hypothetical protein